MLCFLWLFRLFWPSFNGALAVSNAQHRAVLNTVLSLCGSCVVAFLASYALRREAKFHMVDIQNATLAGGVAMGACADMLIQPGSAIGIGGVAGLVSVFGYVHVQGFLERKLGLHDTCGVNNLHGMPSLIGGFASVIAASQAQAGDSHSHQGYGFAQLYNLFPARAPNADGSEGRTAQQQAAIQFAYMVTSVSISLVAGCMAGHFATTRPFKQISPDAMYVDAEMWEVPKLETPCQCIHTHSTQRQTPPANKQPNSARQGGGGRR